MDLSLSLSINATRPRDGTSGGAGPVALAPVPGILDAANVVILGASLFAGMDPGPYFAQAGFTGTFHNYAVGGHKVADAIGQHALADAALAADRGRNVYIAHIGGNNVSGPRPYPGQAEIFRSDYDTLAANITGNGDIFIPLPLTKRLYGIDEAGYPNNPLDVVQGDAASEANGSKPYNAAIIHPKIAEVAPAFLRGPDDPFVSPYRFVDAHPEILGSDGIHGPGAPLWRHVLARVAGRAMGLADGQSRAGTSIVYSVEKAHPDDMEMGAQANRLMGYGAAPIERELFDGALRTDGTLDPFIQARLGPFQNASNGMDASAYARLPDSRFHTLDIVSRGIYIQGSQIFEMIFAGLTPGDSVRISCCGVRSAGTAGNNRRGIVALAGQTRELDAANDAASNQVVFDPVAVPASGELALSVTVAPGSTYAYLHGIIMDFL